MRVAYNAPSRRRDGGLAAKEHHAFCPWRLLQSVRVVPLPAWRVNRTLGGGGGLYIVQYGV